LFYAGATMGGNAGVTPLILDPHANTVVKNVPGLAVTDRDQGASVILPPAQDQKIMVMGGSGSTSVAIADLKMVNPSYNEVNNLQFGRMHLNAVLLPDRTVFVSGGSKSGENMMTAVRESEIYHPLSGNWTLGATATVARLYHSIALLLPDGRVITAGSNPVRKDDELRLELYHPSYLFRGPRPFIANVKEQLHRGLTFEIETPQATQIKWVHLIKPMATTHSWDSSQRLIDIPFTCEEVCHLKCCVPEQQNIVIPGWYMLFIVNHDEIPSVAKWVQIKL
jgi:hypothetical protein